MRKTKASDPLGKGLARAVWQHRFLTLLLVLMIAASVIISVYPPLVLAELIDHILEGNILRYAILYFALTALGGLTDSGREVLIAVFGQKITHSLRSIMADKLYRLPAEYYVTTESGVTVSRIVNDVSAVETLFTSGIVSMAADVCKVISILIVVFTRSTGLGMLLILLLPVLFYITRLFQKRMLAAQKDRQKAVGSANAQIPETLHNLRALHVFRAEGWMRKRYSRFIRDGFQAMERSNFYDAIYSPIILFTSAFLVAVMMCCASAGGRFASLFGLTVGGAAAMISYVSKIFEPLEAIGMEIQNVQTAFAGISRIRELLQAAERVCPPETAEPVPDTDTQPGAAVNSTADPVVSCTDLSFSYVPEIPILRDFSLELMPEESVTLAGRTGIGKSTLFKLILGLYTPQKGTIRVFGQDPEEIPDAWKRFLYGYVEQTFRPVPGTIEDQISLSDPRISREAVLAALDTVGLLPTVEALPEKEQTAFSAGLFSQGQLQLLSIARAIAADPKLLLLDEITSGLDSLTEARVLDALRKACENRTVFSISHRLYEQTGGRRIVLERPDGTAESADSAPVPSC
ncbi:MAG: ABC transporter ATP-binding protein [Firmicutes bacterium]|nr:ABC transporter ATP-binding protein [Bacillota bacterium]